MEPVIIICVIVVVLFAAIMAILSRYRKCPSDKVLVIYGKVGTTPSPNRAASLYIMW